MPNKTFSKPFVYLLITLVSAGFIFGYAWHQRDRLKVLEMYVFDLKSNEAIFIRTPNDRRILINGGANSEIIRELTKILPFYSRKIDTIIATNTNGKNVSGLIDVLKRYSVGKVILPAVTLESIGLSTSTDHVYSVFLDTIKEKGIEVERVKKGDRVEFDSVSFNILFPTASESFKYSKASGPELVMKISYDKNSIFILNNVTPKIQKYIASSTAPVTGTTAPSLLAGGALPRSSANLADSSGDSSHPSDGAKNNLVLVVFNNASPDNLASELTNELKPEYLIYSKSLTSSNPKSVVAKKDKIDPLFYLLVDHRFNIKEKGTIKIVSDGSLLEIGD